MSEYPTSWDEIPEREPLPAVSGGRGPGIQGEDLDKIKIKDHLNEPFAVIGFLILPNGFKKAPEDPDEYAMVEVMDKSGECFVFTTTSKSLLGQLESRHNRDEIPFRTTVMQVPSKKNPAISYYTFS